MANNIWDLFDQVKNEEAEQASSSLDTSAHAAEDPFHSTASGTLEDDEDDEVLREMCTYCEKNSLVYDAGAYYCGICGVYQQKILSQSAEYRYYGDGDNKSKNPVRVGMPTNILLPQSSLGSLIAYRPYESHTFQRMIRFNKWNAMPYKERSQWRVFSAIQTKCKKAGLPNIIIELAKSYYKNISETSISRGANRQGLIAACVYMACKKESVPRSSKEIASIFGIDLQDMTRGCKKFKEIWRLSSSKSKIHIRTSNPLDYIDRFCSNLQLSHDIKYISEFVATKSLIFFNNVVQDNTAPSIAAGSIFMVCFYCNHNITKRQVASACKISEVTISKCFKKLNKYARNLLPKKIVATKLPPESSETVDSATETPMFESGSSSNSDSDVA